ncbi:MAG TPA: type IV pilus twitching motility protein PilT [Gemmatimonadales bacterium]|nr:type IV pilus twitching motility protein PilT [Gemmatimonadales bacterium]
MPRIDRFLTAMKQHGGEALVLGAGAPIRVRRGADHHPLTKDALSQAQYIALLREIAPGDAAAKVGQEADLRFAYASPIGPVDVWFDAGGTAATLRPAGAGPGVSVGGPAPSAALEAPDLEEPRREMDRLLRRQVEAGGSDLHLRSGVIPMLRKDGELIRLDEPAIPAERIELLLRSIIEPLKWLEYLDRNDLDYAYELPGVARFRCNAARDRFGPMGVFRQIPTEVRSAEDLGLSKEVQALCSMSKGLVLVTGPTGSGKSTTLAAMVDLVNRSRTDHIITIEDPIEFVHQSKRCLVTQRQVGLHTESFKAALRAALREDPDVVLVGELRDLETIAIAIETAETGHLVFGTLHTTTAASTIDRLIDQFPSDRQPQIRVMLSESLRGVVAQVLCRKIGGGRVAAREVLLSIPAVSNLIREGKTFQIPSIMQTNRKAGMVTLNDALLDLVDQGLVEPKEAYLTSVERQGLVASLKAKGINTSFVGEG